FTWLHNTLIAPSDFAPLTLISPLNGQPLTVYNLDPAKRGLVANVVERAPNDSLVFNGVDITVSGRFGRGGVLTGGVAMGRTALNRCTVSDPNLLRFCNFTPPFTASNQYKTIVTYPLPYGVQLSGVLQSLPFVNQSSAGF